MKENLTNSLMYLNVLKFYRNLICLFLGIMLILLLIILPLLFMKQEALILIGRPLLVTLMITFAYLFYLYIYLKIVFEKIFHITLYVRHHKRQWVYYSGGNKQLNKQIHFIALWERIQELGQCYVYFRNVRSEWIVKSWNWPDKKPPDEGLL